MDRAEFLKLCGLNFFKPILLIGVLIFSLRFLIMDATESGAERLMIVILIGLIILAVVSYLINLILVNIIQKIRSNLSERALLTMSIIEKVLSYLSTIALGVIIYYNRQENTISAILFFSVFLLIQVVDIVKKEKRSLQ